MTTVFSGFLSPLGPTLTTVYLPFFLSDWISTSLQVMPMSFGALVIFKDSGLANTSTLTPSGNLLFAKQPKEVLINFPSTMPLSLFMSPKKEAGTINQQFRHTRESLKAVMHFVNLEYNILLAHFENNKVYIKIAYFIVIISSFKGLY